MKYSKNKTYQSEGEKIEKINDKSGKANNNTAVALQFSEKSGVMKYQGIATPSPKVAILAKSGQDCIAINTYSPDSPTRNFDFTNFQLYLWAKNNVVYCIIDGKFVELDFLAFFFEPTSRNITRFLYFDGIKISQMVFDEAAVEPIFDLCMNRFYPERIENLKDETKHQEEIFYEQR